ncbi:hypothetical protein [Paenibacillus lutrae]|uniref:Uncharacterized protein n=1 Tax=Paenibacillus lutrae TaxID=2078573 RepID=A0A7X3JZ57_9BACL|nr:hypothetical protein [Paenibacillus lutrae]MVO99722.1 hypothetical protein [Paenibacillus lutrae]
MKNKKIILVFSFVVLIVTSGVSFAALGKEKSKFEYVTESFSKHSPAPGPNGEKVKYVEKFYKKNDQLLTASKMKKVEELSGYLDEEKLAKKGGKYIRKEMMTYKEYINLGVDDSYMHDVDPDRLVWVISTKFNKTHYVDGNPVEKANVTSLFDAETGEFLSVTVTSDAPNAFSEFKKGE